MSEILVNMRYDGPERTIAERAYRLLREDIISGALAPGLKLKIEMLRTRYGLGAAPIREALARLSSDHLVKLEGQRGCEVVPMSVADARDIGNMRKLLEVEALRISIGNGDEEWENALAAAFHRLERLERTIDQGIDDLAEWETLNHQFHKALVAACDSAWLLRMRQLMFDQHERYRRLSRVKTVATRDISLEHRALFEAALDRDAEKAVTVMETHIGRTTDAVVHTFARHELAEEALRHKEA
ncbi:GntR family transcriptional regulator [Nitratireductor aquibiodomus]|uniref:GntR family transcriptional regulator n=1 Tax=Nitratireductor aquibiodomus TaxID=204799 RepID=UPI000469935B|nr:FCD domain-containing protein [Nitratireductor aquibiodomus]